MKYPDIQVSEDIPSLGPSLLSQSIHFLPLFPDRVHYNVIEILAAPDICFHRGAPTNVGIQHHYHIPSGTSAYCYSGLSW